MGNAKKKTSSISDARKLTKRIATSMAKMVDDLAKLRPIAEEIKTKLDGTSEQGMADCMYKFYGEVARLEDELADYQYYFKDMYETFGGTDSIPDPKN
jgi:hypothetical protein